MSIEACDIVLCTQEHPPDSFTCHFQQYNICDKSFFEDIRSFADVVQLKSVSQVNKRTPLHNLVSHDTEAGRTIQFSLDTLQAGDAVFNGVRHELFVIFQTSH